MAGRRQGIGMALIAAAALAAPAWAQGASAPAKPAAAEAPRIPVGVVEPGALDPRNITVVRPADLSDESHWKAYQGRPFKPSTDQHLTDPILKGAIDLHAHFGPDTYSRQWDAFEIAKLAKERGMRAVVIKNHWTESAGTAWMTRKYAGADGVEVFGALVLDAPMGGINPEAVRYFGEIEGKLGRVVWFPTHDSEHEVKYLRQKRAYVRVSDEKGLLPPVLQVLDLIAKYDLTLGTGHVTPEEMLAIVREAKKRGVKRIIITHPHLGPMYTAASLAQLREAIALGGKVEFVMQNLLRDPLRPKTLEAIRALGPENCFVATDSGITGTPNHPDALAMGIQTLRKAGFSEKELSLMFRDNPAKLLGLPPLP